MRTDRRLATRVAIALLAIVLGALCLAKAWVSDDAYITIRTIDNLHHGLGPRWNADERVQAYTHPLWMFLLAAVTAVTREHYVTTMILGLVVSALAVLLLAARVARTPAQVAFVLVAFAASHGFTDYATSGLENPLVHLLLAGFVVAWCAPPERVRPELLFVLGAALACTRLDALLLVAPPLMAFVVVRRPPWRVVVPGALLLLAWLIFALVYYGSIVPTSALAKVAHDLPRSTLLRQGFDTLASAFHREPGAVLVLLAGIVVPLVQGDRVARPLVAGIVLHILYTIWVGGDFMSGRFLTPTVFLAVGLLARAAIRPQRVLALAGIAIAATGITTAVERQRVAQLPGSERHFATIDDRGIADERRFYATITGWRARRPGLAWPDPGATAMAAALLDEWTADPYVDLVRDLGLITGTDSLPPGAVEAVQSGRARPVAMRAAVGVVGYRLGSRFYVLDLCSLGDPLRARMPAEKIDPFVARFLPRIKDAVPFRPGHYTRRVPQGYATTLLLGENHLEDPDLASLWSDVALLTRAPLFAPGRWSAIARLALPRPDPRARRWWARTAARTP